MARVRFDGVEKDFGALTVLRDFTLDIANDEFLVLVGPSGCGKSTTLRILAGLEQATRGDVFIDDRRVNDVAPRDRDVAMVFQNYALYPHMTVHENLAFGLRLRGCPRAETDRRIRYAASILGIESLLMRQPKQLSGGQRQRVAIGRAIVREPRVFLMDEPLSNLDAQMRIQMRAELAKLHRQVRTTCVYVTHDQTEAMTLADRMVVMDGGAIQQVGTPHEIYRRPANTFVAGFIGSPAMNFISCRVEPDRAGLRVFASDVLSFVPDSSLSRRLESSRGREVLLGLRPEDLMLVSASASGPTMKGSVEIVEPLGAETIVHLVVGSQTLVLRIAGEARLQVGENVYVGWRADRAHLFDRTTGNAIRETTESAQATPTSAPGMVGV